MQSPSRPTVLIVDDEAIFCSIAADGLRASALGCEVLTAGNGREALEVLARQPVDLVVTDLRMPELDGLELLSELMRRSPRLPVIVMTAYGTPAMEERVERDGAVAYLEKPIDFDQLRETIAELLQRATGHLSGISLASFLQLLQLERKSARLTLTFPHGKGTLTFVDGALVHAELDDRYGEEAALALLAPGPSPAIEIFALGAVPTTTVRTPLAHLLLEAARVSDEAGDETAEIAFDWADDGDATQVIVPEAPLFAAGVAEGLLAEALRLQGARWAAAVELPAGRLLAAAWAGQAFAVEGPAVAEAVRAALRLQASLGLAEEIEELLVSAAAQFQLVRMVAGTPRVALCVAVDRRAPNLAMLRFEARRLAEQLAALRPAGLR